MQGNLDSVPKSLRKSFQTPKSQNLGFINHSSVRQKKRAASTKNSVSKHLDVPFGRKFGWINKLGSVGYFTPNYIPPLYKQVIINYPLIPSPFDPSPLPSKRRHPKIPPFFEPFEDDLLRSADHHWRCPPNRHLSGLLRSEKWGGSENATLNGCALEEAKNIHQKSNGTLPTDP